MPSGNPTLDAPVKDMCYNMPVDTKQETQMNRRDFIRMGAVGGVAAAFQGCMTSIDAPQARNADPFGTLAAKPKPEDSLLEQLAAPAPKAKPEFHVFSKMFQPPLCKDYDAIAELMAKAGFDGIEWTVRPKGHVLPENAKTDLPKAVEAARKQGLKSTMIVTGFTDGDAPESETLLKVAADCGVKQYRPGYFFYDVKKETFQQSFERIKAGFASLAKLSERTGVKTVYQNHSSWGPSVFGGLVWDVWEAIRDLDPKWVGLEYDPMHAFFETNLSWSHGLELVADRIGAVCLKDFHYQLSKKNPKDHAKFMCAAGEGIVPWKEVKRLLDMHKVKAPFVVHFEYKFDEKDLLKTVKGELDFFKSIFA